LNQEKPNPVTAAEIMVVDDEPSGLRLLSEILSGGGYKVRSAVDGASALKSAKDRLPDLILLDILMPGMEGVEVCRRLKADPQTKNLPVIFLSAFEETELKVQSLEAGGSDYITKPYVAMEVLARIKTQLEIYGLQKKLVKQTALLISEISDRKQTLEILRLRERQLTLIHESVTDIIFVIGVEPDNQFRFLSVNDSFTRETGVPKDQVIGKLFQEVIPESAQSLVLSKYKQAIQKREVTHWEEISTYPKGTIVGLVSVSPIFDSRGECKRLIGTIHNNTQRSQNEKVLRESEEKFRIMFNSGNDAVFVHQPENDPNTFIEVNDIACDSLGYSRAELLQMLPFEITDQEPEVINGVLQEIMREGGSVFESVHVTKAGKKFPVEISTQKFEYNGKPTFISFARNITDRKQAEAQRLLLEAQLRQAQKLEAVGTMVGGISHELNNILQSMFLYGGLVQRMLPEDKNLRANFQHILTDGERARDIVKQILTFSRKNKVDLQPYAIHDIVLEALSFMRSALPPNIDIQQDIDMNCGLVRCDKTQIHQIIINLCNNAQQAMEEKGGTLNVSLNQIRASLTKGDPKTDVLELIVSDTGHGIDPTDLEKILDPFFTTRQFGRGTGLGLSVIHGILEMMGGKIAASSEPGVGAKFQLLFPVIDRVDRELVPPPIEIPVANEQTILLVDDEESIRIATQLALTEKGFAVECLSDGEQALKFFKANPDKYDLIVTDQSMLKMSGTDFSREIRKSGSNIPILLSTGHFDVESKKEYQNMGISGIIQKPWTVDELMERIIKELKVFNLKYTTLGSKE